jgi:nucleoside-diphosphate-sugar epimerase
VRALVTGGGGFLGSAICRALMARGDDVRSLSRGAHPELAELGVEHVRGDLTDADAVRYAVEGVDTVFHTAALAGVWGPRKAFHGANVVGTRNVLEACRQGGVRRLVHTSTPSVCFDGRDHVNAGPDLPLAKRFLAPYPETKAIAEREVLAANDDELSTCALRPHLLVGPGDPHLLPRLIERARAGKLVRVGDGTNVVSLTWTPDAARAHLSAADRLGPGAACAGRAYFLAQAEPVRLWPWIEEVLERIGCPGPSRSLSLPKARAAGAVAELLWRALPLSGEPPLTRFVALQLATSHSYDLAPVKQDLGFTPSLSMAEVTDRLVEHYGAPEPDPQTETDPGLEAEPESPPPVTSAR